MPAMGHTLKETERWRVNLRMYKTWAFGRGKSSRLEPPRRRWLENAYDVTLSGQMLAKWRPTLHTVRSRKIVAVMWGPLPFSLHCYLEFS